MWKSKRKLIHWVVGLLWLEEWQKFRLHNRSWWKLDDLSSVIYSNRAENAHCACKRLFQPSKLWNRFTPRSKLGKVLRICTEALKVRFCAFGGRWKLGQVGNQAFRAFKLKIASFSKNVAKNSDCSNISYFDKTDKSIPPLERLESRWHSSRRAHFVVKSQKL